MRVPVFKAQRQDWTGLTPGVITPTGADYLAEGLQNLSSSLMRKQKEHEDKMNRLLVQDKKNDLLNDRRQRYIANSKNPDYQLSGANGFTRLERDKLETTREEFMRDTPGDLQDDLTIVFDNVSKTHLDRTASFEMSQTKQWEEIVQSKTVIEAQQKAIALPLGDIEGLNGVLAELKNSLPEVPVKAQIHGRDIIVNTFRSWARVNPKGAEQVAAKHLSQLQEQLGTDYNKLGKAIQEGKLLFEWEKETKHKWSQRQLTKHQESTIKEGVVTFLDPKKLLTTQWIINKEKDMSSTQMRILYSLLRVQNSGAEESIALSQVNWQTYAYLSSMVRDKEVRRIGQNELVNQIIGAMDRKEIMYRQGQDFLKQITSKAVDDYELKNALDDVGKMYFDKETTNAQLAIKGRFKSMVMRERLRNPNGDLGKFMEETIYKEYKDIVQDEVDNFMKEPPINKTIMYLDERIMPEMTETEENQVRLTLKQLKASGVSFEQLEALGLGENPTLKEDVETTKTLLRLIRQKNKREGITREQIRRSREMRRRDPRGARR